MLRCCYVNEGDPTKPLLGIFAIKTIYTGDEITLSYSGQLNLGELLAEWLKPLKLELTLMAPE